MSVAWRAGAIISCICILRLDQKTPTYSPKTAEEECDHPFKVKCLQQTCIHPIAIGRFSVSRLIRIYSADYGID